MSVRQMTQPGLDFSKVSVAQLQEQLKQCWVRCEKTVKDEMAPRLYYLRLQLKKQGSRTGEGFSVWVKANLGLSLSTVNRWANEYGVAIGEIKLRSPKTTSGQMPRSADDEDGGQFPVQLVLPSTAQRVTFKRAWQTVGPEEGTRLIYETITQRQRYEGRA